MRLEEGGLAWGGGGLHSCDLRQGVVKTAKNFLREVRTAEQLLAA